MYTYCIYSNVIELSNDTLRNVNVYGQHLAGLV